MAGDKNPDKPPPVLLVVFQEAVNVLSFDDMKILIARLLTSFFIAAVAQADYSEPFTEIDATALETVDDFIPPGWKAIALAQGDLNDDERLDYALVIQDTDPDNIQGDGGLIATEVDVNPRHLLLLFGGDAEAGEMLSRKRIYRKFIPGLNPDEPDLAEPLSYVGINEGALEVKFEVWGGAYSFERDDITFRFRYDEASETFPLISFDHRNVHKATGMFKDFKADLVRNKLHKAAGSMSSPKHRKESGAFIPAQDWTPCDIKEPLVFKPS